MCQTRSGVWFDPSADHWHYRDGIDLSLDFSSLSGVTDKFVDATKRVLAWYTQESSPSHVQNLFYRLLHFTRTIARTQLDAIRAPDLLNYRSKLTPDTEWYLGTLRGLFIRWHQLGYQGVDADAILLLKQLRIKGNQKGVAVMTMDPEDGPFTPIEVEAIQASVNNAYAEGDITTAEFVHIWLTMLLGQRPTQYSALKVIDVKRSTTPSGGVEYAIQMPSAKKRFADRRAGMKERKLIEQFGEILFSYKEMLIRKHGYLLEDPNQLPLFIDPWTGRATAPGFEHHYTPNALGLQLTYILEHLAIISERTGCAMSISPVRFRRTIGTRAAEEGYGPLVIAELLDHADTQNVGVYTASTPTYIEKMTRTLAMDMAPLAQAFEGTLATGDKSKIDPAKLIIDLRIDRSGEGMGKCGMSGYCSFNAPIACYTCRNFEAWLDGPHEAVLDHLMKRREMLLKASDKRIAMVNDRTILAVAEVIQKCQTALADRNSGGKAIA